MIYLNKETNLPSLLQPKGGGYSNLCFLLGCSNWILAGNAYMNPWVHLQTISQNYRAVEMNSSLIAEMEINKIYEKKDMNLLMSLSTYSMKVMNRVLCL